MSFQPLLPATGLAGWRFLERTLDTQGDAFAKSPAMLRDTEYFEANIGAVRSAEELVSDRRLLRVALGAFGLGDDIDNRFFIRTILEEGTLTDDALANKLSDDRYRAFSAAFGFGDFATPRTAISDFPAEIVDKFRRQSFEVAVGEQDDSLRLALNATRSLGDIADGGEGSDTKWFKVMGTPPLRNVFETAFNLPSSFAQLDLDRQLETLSDRAESAFGVTDFSDFADPEVQDRLVQRFLLSSQLSGFQASSAGAVALTLLQSMPDPYP